MTPTDVILLGDCAEVLKTFDDASVDAVVTDPPYGLGTREPTVEEIIAYLQGSSLDTGGDFMKREWEIPPIAVWRECFRVLKPGGYLLSFAGTRTLDLVGVGIRAAGFECRDSIATEFGPIAFHWMHGQGFPKSLNVGKAIDAMTLHGGSNSKKLKQTNDEDRTGGERVRASTQNNGILGEKRDGRVIRDEPATKAGGEWNGWGTALKPSWEPVLVFRKPFEGSVAENILKHGTGAMNIDATRVAGGPGYEDEVRKNVEAFGKLQAKNPGWKNSSEYAPNIEGALKGRWPPNVLMVHSDGCQKIGTRKVDAPVINRFEDGMKPFGEGAGHDYTSVQTGDAEGKEEIDVWECVEGCPVRSLDDQSGSSKSNIRRGGEGESLDPTQENWRFKRAEGGYTDKGGASRFFPQFVPEAPFRYAAKVTKSEATVKGAVQNAHPTKKPVALMRWLVKLVTRKGGLVLDPYCGSGSTCVAAIEEDAHFIGIERDAASQETAAKRTGIYQEKAQENQSGRNIMALMQQMCDEDDGEAP